MFHFHNYKKVDTNRSSFKNHYECEKCGHRKVTESGVLGWSEYEVENEWTRNRLNEFFKYDTTLKTMNDFKLASSYFKLDTEIYEESHKLYIYILSDVKWYSWFKKSQIKKFIGFVEYNKIAGVELKYRISKNVEIKKNPKL